VGVGGDGDCVNAFDVDISGAPGQFTCAVGPTERLLIDMSDAEKFYETQPLGQSGHFLSANRTDQLQSWLVAKPLPVAFSDEQSARQQRHKVILTPGGAP
jgi:acyl-homoserine lactone acylase PvdQ